MTFHLLFISVFICAASVTTIEVVICWGGITPTHFLANCSDFLLTEGLKLQFSNSCCCLLSCSCLTFSSLSYKEINFWSKIKYEFVPHKFFIMRIKISLWSSILGHFYGLLVYLRLYLINIYFQVLVTLNEYSSLSSLLFKKFVP